MFSARNCTLGLVLFLLPLLFVSVAAHELRPAYLSITEIEQNRYQVLWKTPALGDKQLGLNVRLPQLCVESNGERMVEPYKFAIETWELDCPKSLQGQLLTVAGLEKTLTDVLVRTQWLDGANNTFLLAADKPELIFQKSVIGGVVRTYFVLGLEHILSGLDHLSFVIAIMLLIVGRKQLLFTITAFTLGHSITLALSTIEVVRIQPAIVEPLIALSIVLMAYEAMRKWQGQTGFTMEHPWLVSFAFGLLHGFGFAGALRAIGLPDSDFVLALLFFNVGIEAGQLLFIASILLLALVVFKKIIPPAHRVVVPVAYLIGSVGVYWCIERTAGIFLSL